LSWKKIKTALRIGLIQIHSKNETNTFEKIFWVQGCFEDYFLHTSKLHQHSVFFVNPQPLVLIPIYTNHFLGKNKRPAPIGAGLFVEQYVKIN
tara:strand:- start:2774 stop:3052 length:279 start_codon:yes stop_codon:yes gene_type:complete